MKDNMRSHLKQYVDLHWKLFNEVLNINELNVSTWLEDTYGSKNLHNIDLRGFDFSYANLDGVDFSGSDLLGINFRGASLINANFKGATLMGAVLDQAKMVNCNLIEADLRGASIYNTDFENSDFCGAILNDLRNPQECNFKNANLHSVCLKSLNLEHTNFQNANLCNSNLEDTVLQYANLQKANLEGASLKASDLSKANISYVQGINVNQLSEASCIFSAYIDDEDQRTIDILDILEESTNHSINDDALGSCSEIQESNLVNA